MGSSLRVTPAAHMPLKTV